MKMGLLEELDQRVKKFSFMDVKLAQGAAMFGALIIAKIIPDIMDLNIWWFIVLLVVCAIKPASVFLLNE
jgi:hypothetical protein